MLSKFNELLPKLEFDSAFVGSTRHFSTSSLRTAAWDIGLPHNFP
jgi:hypothetical protein